MAFLTYRQAITPTAPGATTLKGTQLTHAELDGNFKSLNDALGGLQPTLASGTNIKTVNGTSILGSGDVAVQPSLVSGTNIKTINSASLLGSGDLTVQASLVSGTNIKTVNGSSLLGAGNVVVQAPLDSGNNIKTVNGASLVGSGNVTVQEVLVSANNIKTINGASLLGSTDILVQSPLVSGTNIKTINGASIMGTGDLSVSSMVYPGSGLPVSTGTGWSTSKVAPSGDIVGTSDTQVLTSKSISLTTNTLSGTSAELAAAITDETGSGALVFASSPTFSGHPLGNFTLPTEVDIVAASQTDIGSQSSRLIRVTGNTGITSFGTNYRGPIFLRFEQALTIAHHATTLIIPGGANITVAAGDSCIVVPKTNGAGGAFNGWRIDSYAKATKNPTIDAADINLTDDTATASAHYLTYSTASSGAVSGLKASSTKLQFTPSTGTLAATIFNSLSDANAKENITSVYNATNIINRLRGVEFEWKDNHQKSSGVIAQELETVLSFLVETNAEGVKTVNYSGLIGFLIPAIQELDARIRKLELSQGMN